MAPFEELGGYKETIARLCGLACSANKSIWLYKGPLMTGIASGPVSKFM